MDVGSDCRVRTALGQVHVSELRIEKILRRQRNALLFDLAPRQMDIPRPPSIAEGIGILGSGPQLSQLPSGRHLGDGLGHGGSVVESPVGVKSVVGARHKAGSAYPSAQRAGRL